MSRPNKRSRTTGHSYHNVIPIGTDDLLDVQARDGHLIKFGSQSFTAPPARTTQKLSEHWKAVEWTPKDDTEFALDSDGALYDSIVEVPVMDTDHSPVTASKEKSQVSVSLLNPLFIPLD